MNKSDYIWIFDIAFHEVSTQPIFDDEQFSVIQSKYSTLL